jgi:hypothetical protein
MLFTPIYSDNPLFFFHLETKVSAGFPKIQQIHHVRLTEAGTSTSYNRLGGEGGGVPSTRAASPCSSESCRAAACPSRPVGRPCWCRAEARRRRDRGRQPSSPPIRRRSVAVAVPCLVAVVMGEISPPHIRSGLSLWRLPAAIKSYKYNGATAELSPI